MAVDRIKYIKEKYTCVEMAQMLGLPIRKSGDRCISLAPDSKNPTAMIVFDDRWHDFKQGCGGDVIDLYAEAKYNGDKGKAIRELGGDCGNQDWKTYTKELNGHIELWHNELRENDIKYLNRRGIKKSTIDRLKLGYDATEDRLIIPYFKNGYTAYYIGRDRSGKEGVSKYKKAHLDGLNENIPWGLHTLSDKHVEYMTKGFSSEKKDLINKFIVIAEGAFDAMSFEQEGFRVLSPISGYFSKEAKKQVLDLLKAADSVFVCFDNDKAGTRFTQDLCKELFKKRIKFVCGVLPQKYKDISEYYEDGGDLFELVKNAQNGIIMLAEHITEQEEFKNFMHNAARFVEASDLTLLCENIKAFPAKWVNSVLRESLKIPPEKKIVKEINSQHTLKYIENLGFYEYRHGVWLYRSNNEIGRYFIEILGIQASNTKVMSLIGYLEKDLTSREVFNRKPLFNFRNGVLELETGNFRDHNPNDMSSIQVDYDYDPEAKSSKFEAFISQIMAGRKPSINLLQEMFGYVFFNDCSLQKCFFLIGSGANGKSVLLNILRALVGKENVSNVEMSGLTEQFQRIKLLNSLVNISTETASNVKGAESIFKQVVVGDEINGCYKNKDYVEFAPRCVMISACNGYIKARDDTTGFLRRICFVDFPCEFKGSKADKKLEDKLKLELSGIFNWAYEGYKRLKAQSGFTDTPEQDELISDFRKSINPIAAFIEDELLNQEGQLTRKQLYNKYVEWTKEAGHEALSRTNFIRKFRMTMKQTLPNVKEKSIHTERYFDFTDNIQPFEPEQNINNWPDNEYEFLTAADFEDEDDAAD